MAEKSQESAAAAELPLYGDPFAGSGPCRLAISIEPERRRQVTQLCPRCGTAGAQRPDAPCLLQGIELDQLALDDDDPILTFLRLVRDGEDAV